MKVSIQNLGAVKQAEIEIKPLTVFVGENGTGKTWVAHSLAGILGTFGFTDFALCYRLRLLKTDIKFPLIEQAVQKVIDEGNAQIDVVQFAENYIIECFNAVADHAKQWLPHFLLASSSDWSETRIRFGSVDIASIMQRIKDMEITHGLSFGSNGHPLLSLSKKRGENRLYVVTTSPDITSVISQNLIREAVVSTVFICLRRSVYENVIFLPIGRIVMATQSSEAPAISEAHSLESEDIVYHGRLTADIEASAILRHTLELISIGRDEEALNGDNRLDYVQLARLLEEGILRGRVSCRQSAANYWELHYDFGEGRSLALRAASSMVKELALLVLYLRYLAKHNDAIVIDEPEMNLHPEAQAKMTEFLCMLVNAGLNVIVTTHSSYIIDHLANLLKAAKSNNKAELAKRFFLKDERAFIEQDKVSVYHFENGSAHSILDEDGYIDWKTFSDVSDTLMRLSYEMDKSVDKPVEVGV